ncbi:MAG: amidohydrolase, partial [Planctomycetota bacterium]
MSERPESLILANCAVWTGDSYVADAAVGITDGRIATVGKPEDVRWRLGATAREIDLGGRLVLPGFIDSHVHLLAGGQHLSGLDLRDAGGREEFVDRIRGAVETAPPGRWLTGGRWDNARWPGSPLPHRDWIDPVTAENPVWVTRADGHIGLANSRALEIAGITPATSDPPGGRIDQDAAGQPTGILRDAAITLVRDRIPAPSEGEKVEILKRACNHAASLGVTAVSDMDSRGILAALSGLAAAGDLPCRVIHWIGLERRREAAELKHSGEFETGLVRIPGVKAFVDGSLGARTAWMFEPYDDDPGNAGLAMDGVEDGRFEADLRSALAAGLDAAVHAIGDRANAFALDLFERLIRDGAAEGRILRIEHAQHLR